MKCGLQTVKSIVSIVSVYENYTPLWNNYYALKFTKILISWISLKQA